MKTLDISEKKEIKIKEEYEMMTSNGSWILTGSYEGLKSAATYVVKLQDLALSSGYDYFLGQFSNGEHTLFRVKRTQ